MNKKSQIQKLILAAFLVLAGQLVFAAFTSTIAGRAGKKAQSDKYTLTNISKFSNKGLSLGTVRYSLKLKATEMTSKPAPQGGLVYNTNLEFTRGNTTVIYPYKVKLKVPKFKAPSPIN